jgi:heptosyltransferase-3
MNFPESIFNWTRSFFPEVAENMENSGARLQIELNRNQTKRILICRPNHRLGNLLLLTPLLQEVAEVFPDCKIDLFVKGNLSRILFENYKNIDRIIQLPKRPFQRLINYVYTWTLIKKYEYDMVINVDQSSSSGRLSVRIANSRRKVLGEVVDVLKSQFNDYEHHAKFPVYNFRNHLKKMRIVELDKPIPTLNLKLDPFELSSGKKILNRLVPSRKKTICLFTYATGDKCYSESWWNDFYERLRIEFPHFNFIEVLPIQNVSKLSFKVPTFYSRDIRQIGAVIANTHLFIGADSGMMHLASAAHVPTVGLFSVTDQKRYEPYNNNSIAINTNYRNTETCVHTVAAVLDGIGLEKGNWIDKMKSRVIEDNPPSTGLLSARSIFANDKM